MAAQDSRASSTEAFTKSGFRGGLNYYRNLDRNWQLQASLAGLKVHKPALFIAGERDAGLQIPGMAEIIRSMPKLAPHVREPFIIAGAGHWLPQERPDQISTAIVEFAHVAFAPVSEHAMRA
ncbi:alpha/beta fold hydrolase [Bradyrhizobium frederickii]|uniref:alpha/beta fold hydrolase n=1 Tax=Bradyrhizobium frederickii TaxID=2560054 RepID=UPI001431B077|nr:alpha/beta hydrolase [Bradyrhizobium frederickii]